MTEGEGTPTQDPTPAPATPGPKMVPEADLLGMKGNLENQITSLNTTHKGELDALSGKLAIQHTQILQLTADKDRYESDAKTLTEVQPKVTQLETELAQARQSLTDYDVKHLDLRRRLVSIEYGVPVDAMAEKDSAALDAYEEALKAVGKKNEGNYATTPGAGGGDAGSQTHSQRAEAILAEADRKHGITRDSEGRLA